MPEHAFTLPKIGAIRFQDFDLYRKKFDPEVQLDRNVLCLIGANGLGKSTFLNTLNFCITGAVPDPKRSFKSAEEYLTDASRGDRIDQYFSGRISEFRRNLASITVELVWPNLNLTVTRSFFEQNTVSRLELATADGLTVLTRDDEGELEKKYRDIVVEASGVPTYAHFVFLYHFIFTFDEGRHLITWDDRAVTSALYLAFGTNESIASESERLNRAMERASSRARNVRFAAKAVGDRISNLQSVLKDGEDEEDQSTEQDLVATRDAMEKAVGVAHDRLDELIELQQNADLRWTEISSTLTDRQLEYRQVFASRASASSAVHYHPLVRSTIDDDRCAVCQTTGVAHVITARVDHGDCPLCGSELSGPSDDSTLEALREIDIQLIDLRRALEEVLAERARLTQSRAAASANLSAAKHALEAFLGDPERGAALDKAKGKDWIAQEIDKLAKEQSTHLQQAKEHRKKRDDLKEQLNKIEKQLRSDYETASTTFVPRFRALAEQFIGLPIDVVLEHRTGAETAGFRLQLTMDDQLRTSPERLSESQRFFLDIALRMALAEAMTNGPSTLLIDTPEGSLDIAYEARAGQMFDTFAKAGNHIIMTANLRSSELLVNLASLSGRAGMDIVRMTDWTVLTDVQAQEEGRMNEAYAKIEEALA